jgi:hypothetical protein
VTKTNLRAAEGTLSLWSRLYLQSLVPTNPHWARAVGYGLFSLCVIHKEGLCPSSGDINRLMMMMSDVCTLQHKFPTKCMECTVNINTWEALEAHWRKHNVYYKCALCGWFSLSLPCLTRHHHRAHTSVYCCNTCDYSCRSDISHIKPYRLFVQ